VYALAANEVSTEVVAFALAGLALSTRTYAVTVPARVHIPEGYRTIREFTDTILARNYAQLVVRHQHWHEAEVWQVLRGILVEALGVSPEQVTIGARLVEDLGAE
jgi:hypothetical protein